MLTLLTSLKKVIDNHEHVSNGPAWPWWQDNVDFVDSILNILSYLEYFECLQYSEYFGVDLWDHDDNEVDDRDEANSSHPGNLDTK